jgi:hypothetical protein
MTRITTSTCTILLALAAFVPAAAEENAFDGWFVLGKAGIVEVDPPLLESEEHYTVGVEGGRLWGVESNLAIGVSGFFDWISEEQHDSEDIAIEDADFGGFGYGVDGIAGLVLDPLMVYGKAGYAWLEGTGDADMSDQNLHYGAGLALHLGAWAAHAEWTRYEVETILQQDTTFDNYVLGVSIRF